MCFDPFKVVSCSIQLIHHDNDVHEFAGVMWFDVTELVQKFTSDKKISSPDAKHCMRSLFLAKSRIDVYC